MQLLSRSRSIAGSARYAATTRWQTQRAVARARAFARRPAGSVTFCWDLDNTLADSGSLLRSGMPLTDAIVAAEPVENMDDFFRCAHERLPEADHFVLSARTPAMRPATMAWLRKYLGDSDWDPCFVPDVEAKPRVWKQLARSGPLVIVDDLSYDHEGEQPRIRHDLVAVARSAADLYVGFEEISRIQRRRAEVEELVEAIARTVVRDADADAPRR